MSRIVLYGLLIAACMSAAAAVTGGGKTSNHAEGEKRFDAEGAYRDGIFLGRLASGTGQSYQAAIGRWSTNKDREMFTAGYRKGLSGVR